MSADDFVEILAKSSSGDAYVVEFYLEDKAISALCSCPAGGYGRLCKQVLGIMSGDESALYNSDERRAFAKVISHLRETPVPALLAELNRAEVLLATAQNIRTQAKDALEKEVLRR